MEINQLGILIGFISWVRIVTDVKITIGELRQIVKETIAGSQPDETYEDYLLDDPFFNKPSVLIIDDTKKKIKAWAKAMKLTHE